MQVVFEKAALTRGEQAQFVDGEQAVVDPETAAGTGGLDMDGEAARSQERHFAPPPAVKRGLAVDYFAAQLRGEANLTGMDHATILR